MAKPQAERPKLTAKTIAPVAIQVTPEPDELTRLRALDVREQAKRAKSAAYMRGYRARTKGS